MQIKALLKDLVSYDKDTAKDLFILYVLLTGLRLIKDTINYLEQYHPKTINDTKFLTLWEKLQREWDRITRIRDSRRSLSSKLYELSDITRLEQAVSQLGAAILISTNKRVTLFIARYSMFGENAMTIKLLLDAMLAFIKFGLGAMHVGVTCKIYNLTISNLLPRVASMFSLPILKSASNELPTAHSLSNFIAALAYRLQFLRDLHEMLMPYNHLAEVNDEDNDEHSIIRHGSFYIMVNTLCNYIKEYGENFIENTTLLNRLIIGISTAQVAWKVSNMGLYGITKQLANTFYTSGYKRAIAFALQSLTPLALASLVNDLAGFNIWEPNLMAFESKNLGMKATMSVAKYIAIFGIAALGIKYSVDIYKRLTQFKFNALPFMSPQPKSKFLFPSNTLAKLKHSQDSPYTPVEYCCYLTGQLMHNPVITNDGHTYEKDILIAWLKANNPSYNSKNNFEGIVVIQTNRALKELIEGFNKLQANNNNTMLTAPQDSYKCPIHKGIMREPVALIADGTSYEKEALDKWIVTRQRNNLPIESPQTREPIDTNKTYMIPNLALQSLIHNFLAQPTANIDAEDIYLPDAWQEACIAALHSNNLDQVKKWFAKDKRLLRVTLKDKKTAFEIAYEANAIETAYFILENAKPPLIEVSVLKQLLLQAIASKDEAKLQLLVQAGLAVNAPIDARQNTLLHFAAEHNLVKLTKCLLRNKADYSTRNSLNHTPLLTALLHGSKEVAQVLFEAHANSQALSQMLNEQAQKIEEQKMLLQKQQNIIKRIQERAFFYTQDEIMNKGTIGPMAEHVLKPANSNPIWSLVVFPNGNLASVTNMGLAIWETTTWKQIKTLQNNGYNDFSHFTILPNGCLANGTKHGTIDFWDLDRGNCTKTLGAYSDAVSCLIMLPNGYLASGSMDAIIKIWDISSGNCTLELHSCHTAWITCFAILPNNYLASGSADATIKIWDIVNGSCSHTLYASDRGFATTTCLIMLSNGYLASASSDGVIKIWDINNWQCIRKLQGHVKNIYCLIMLPNGYLASASSDGVIKIWDINNWQCIQTLQSHSKDISCLAILPNGRLVSASYDGTIKVWPVAASLSSLLQIANSTSAIPTIPYTNNHPNNHSSRAELIPLLQKQHEVIQQLEKTCLENKYIMEQSKQIATYYLIHCNRPKQVEKNRTTPNLNIKITALRQDLRELNSCKVM